MEQQQTVVNGKAIVRRCAEEILKHLSDQEKSGFTVKEYCEMHDIVEQIFYTWLKKYRTKPEEGPVGFAQIVLVPALGGRYQLLFVPQAGEDVPQFRWARVRKLNRDGQRHYKWGCIYILE